MDLPCTDQVTDTPNLSFRGMQPGSQSVQEMLPCQAPLSGGTRPGGLFHWAKDLHLTSDDWRYVPFSGQDLSVPDDGRSTGASAHPTLKQKHIEFMTEYQPADKKAIKITVGNEACSANQRPRTCHLEDTCPAPRAEWVSLRCLPAG